MWATIDAMNAALGEMKDIIIVWWFLVLQLNYGGNLWLCRDKVEDVEAEASSEEDEVDWVYKSAWKVNDLDPDSDIGLLLGSVSRTSQFTTLLSSRFSPVL